MTRADSPVVICGAGAAGIAAALASAKSGCDVLLVEKSGATGGTVSHCLIHTLGGLFDGHGQLLNSGLPEQLIQRLQDADPTVRQRKMGSLYVLSVHPAVYGEVTGDWLAEASSRLTLLTNSLVNQFEASDSIVQEVTIETPSGRKTVKPRAVIDTTGNASFVAQLAPGKVKLSERSAGGVIARLRGLPKGALEFPKGLGIVKEVREAAIRGELHPSCEHAWIDTGTFNDEAYLKLFAPSDQTKTEVIVEQVWQYLQRFDVIKTARLVQVGQLGVRDGGRVEGEYQLTADDVLAGKSFNDAVCRCCWPIEYWSPEHGIQLQSLPSPDSVYEIPLRALRLKGWRNVFTAGKSLSADHLAQASARVVGSCWTMGEAVGQEAAKCLEI